MNRSGDRAFITKFLQIVPRRDAKALSLKRYFTGKPCPKGHVAERYTGHGSCVACLREFSKSEAKKEYDRAYHKDNSERVAERTIRYRRENSEKLVRKAKEWAAKNPEKRRVISKAYKSRRRQWESGGDKTSVIMEWEANVKKVCYWCAEACEDKYHVDHYKPLSKGGIHEVDNLVIACPPCNLTKSAKDPYEFAAEVGRLF